MPHHGRQTPGLVLEMRRAWRGEDAARLLFSWGLPVIALLSIANERDPRYALPIFPALSIVVVGQFEVTGRFAGC